MLERVEKAPARLIGIGVYNLSANGFRQLTFDELFEDSIHAREIETNRRLDVLRQKYRLDFAGHLEQLYHAETLHKTVEYMRKFAQRTGALGFPETAAEFHDRSRPLLARFFREPVSADRPGLSAYPDSDSLLFIKSQGMTHVIPN